MDHEAWAEAQVRKKPRRTIHNQFLILALNVLIIWLPWVTAGTCFWLIFAVKNFLFGVALSSAWTTAFLIYTALRAYIKRQNKKHKAYNLL